MALLIAPTLLNSYDWLNKCPDSWKEKAYNDILSTLQRKPFVMNEAVKKGIDFEKMVYRYANSNLETLNASYHFKDVCRRVRGYEFQKSVKNYLEVDGIKYVVFGRLDCYSPDEIIDIKTTANFKGDSQYLDGWQHIFYTTLSGVTNFTYLAAEWDEDGSIKDVHEVKYTMEDEQSNLSLIRQGISEFINYIEHDDEMKEAYYKIYNRR